MNKRTPKLWEALLTFSILIVVMGVSIGYYELDPHVPMLVGVMAAVLMSVRLGYQWKELEDAMIKGISQSLQAVIILCLIGVLIGVWITAGVVPTMIYYGLNILKPQFFLVAAALIASITSLATGTSWGTAGTIGIALIGVAKGLGVPAPIAAGAIISGAYFGDKLSPLSDTTNLAPAVSGGDVFSHVKFMAPFTLITYGISLVLYLIIGMNLSIGGADLSAISEIKGGLSQTFVISPFLILPPVLVIGSIAKKVPAIPGIALGIVSGALLGIIIQGANVGEVMKAGYSGYVAETGLTSMDELLTAGGLTGMMYSVSLTIIAMMFGGVMEATGQLATIVDAILRVVKSTLGLVVATLVTCLFSNATMPEQYISIVVPGKMFKPAYDKKNLHPDVLSNTLESSGTITSALIPWNTCGAFLYNVLGVSALQYGPYAFFNVLTPILLIVFTAIGWNIKEKDAPTKGTNATSHRILQ